MRRMGNVNDLNELATLKGLMQHCSSLSILNMYMMPCISIRKPIVYKEELTEMYNQDQDQDQYKPPIYSTPTQTP